MHAPKTITVSPRNLPLAARADVAITGGTVAAAAAALAAAGEGARVFLAAPRLYLGENLCSTLNLYRSDLPDTDEPLLNRIFDGNRLTTPLQVKKVLAAALIDAGIEVVLGSLPVGVLEDENGLLAGMVMANRAGRQAIVAPSLIDATRHGLLARAAGAAGESAAEDVAARRLLMGQTIPEGAVAAGPEASYTYFEDKEAKVWQVDMALSSDRPGPAGWMEIEQVARDRTEEDGLLRSAEVLLYNPGVERTEREGLFHIPWSADEAYGRKTGLGAAAHAPGVSPDGLRVATRSAQSGEQTDLAECLDGIRLADPPGDRIPAGEESLPVLDRVDVLVVGGGTAGAASAISAARDGARVLVAEFQEGLGGIGTVGMIGSPYHGLKIGFAAEVPFPSTSEEGTPPTLEDKMGWLRREVRKAGGAIWIGTTAYGALKRGASVCGAALATPYGHGAVLADVVIDATGNADVAAAAGAETMCSLTTEAIGAQGAGLGSRPLGRDTRNSDYLLVDDSDMVDVTTAFLGSVLCRAPLPDFDQAPILQTRDRRRVVGDLVVSYLDQILEKTYCDTLVVSESDYDAHGYPDHLYFAFLPHTDETRVMNHPAPGGECDTPFRSFLPRGLEGLLVIGIGNSMDRDAGAMMRMQYDLLNQGYATGVAAAMASQGNAALRDLDLKPLQSRLVAMGALPKRVLTDDDNDPAPVESLGEAVSIFLDHSLDFTTRSLAMARLFYRPKAAVDALLAAFKASSDDTARLELAKLLGAFGRNEGVPVLIATLADIPFDDKILQGRMAEYAHLPTPVDALILALGYSHDPRAGEAIVARLGELDATTTLSHHRSVAVALAELGDPRAAEPLARLLSKPGMRDHAMPSIEPLHEYGPEKRRREGALREIMVARALYRCGDYQELGREILIAYTADRRSFLARHARAVL